MTDKEFKIKRLTKESKRLQCAFAKEGGSSCHLKKHKWSAEMTDNVTVWKGKLLGPEGTPYADQLYDLSLDYTKVNYPQKPPKVRFLKQIPYHANVYADGSICVDILTTDWVPSYKTSDLMVSLVSLLNEPNTASPANAEAARAYDADKSADKIVFSGLAAAHYEKNR